MFRPFTTAQAREVGLTPDTVRTRRVRRVHQGVYVESFLEPGLELDVAAARLVLPTDALLDGVSALHALGVEVGDAHPLRFVSTHPHQVRRPGVHVRRVSSLPPGTQDGLVAPAHAFLAAAADLDLVELVAAGDWLVRLDLTSWAELVDVTSAARGRHVRLARRAAGLVRDRVDSPQETRLRLCVVLAGLPEPEVNPVIAVGGRRVGRVDLLLRRWRVVLEYEGDQHRTDKRQWNVDIGRQEQLGEGEWTLVRITHQRMEHPRAVVRSVVRALRSGGWEGPDPVFDAEWHQLFPTAR